MSPADLSGLMLVRREQRVLEVRKQVLMPTLARILLILSLTPWTNRIEMVVSGSGLSG